MAKYRGIPKLGGLSNLPHKRKKKLEEYGQPLTKEETTNIAFKIASSRFNASFAVNDKPNKVLLGIQFRFESNTVDNVSKDYINAYEIFLNPKNGFYSKISVPSLNLEFDNDAFYIDEYKIGYKISGFPSSELKTSHFNLRDNSVLEEIHKVHGKIDFFDSKTESVYFTMDQILPLRTFYSNLIISGCRLKLEKKLTPNKDESMLYDDLNFSLKMEGGDLYDGFINLLKSPNADEIVEGPGAMLGYPCPPEWRTISVLISQALRLNPKVFGNQKDKSVSEIASRAFDSLKAILK